VQVEENDLGGTGANLGEPNTSRASEVHLPRWSAELEEARDIWEEILVRDPPDPDSWYGYPQLCLFLGKESYRRARNARTLQRRYR
jgi:hypothetical protein